MSVDFEDPQVHFIGELSHLLIESMQFPLEEAAFYSISYCVVPGNDLWKLHDGKSFGETQACMIDELSGFITLNHPINLFYNTTSIEGWPCLVVELWEKVDETHRNLVGCGSVWLPLNNENKCIDIKLWYPMQFTKESWFLLDDNLSKPNPELRDIRELIMNPYLRSQSKLKSTGILYLTMNVVSKHLSGVLNPKES